MSITDNLREPIRRLVPHEGLVIDVSTWNASHNFHDIHHRLHAMSMHSPGVVTGLEVVASDPPDSTVMIGPGAAADEEGHTIIVPETLPIQLQTNQPGVHYLVLQYREITEEGSDSPSNDTAPRYTLEAYRLEERTQLPYESYVELARVMVLGSGDAISDAANPGSPRPNEIDLRYRIMSGPPPAGNIRAGVVPLESLPDGQIPHATGASRLIQAVNASTKYLGEFKGAINLSHEVAECDLLVLAGRQGFELIDEWRRNLHDFLERGGLVLGEACGAHGEETNEDTPFRKSFLDLAQQMGRDLTPVEQGHPILSAHHVFSGPPEGIDGPSALVADGGIFYSDGDYGCLWAGGRPGRPATREAIRSATELGINLGVFAAQGAHLRSVKERANGSR